VALSVGVEQVVRAGGILIDAAFHQTHSQHGRVKINIVLRRTGDARYVVDTGYARHFALC
jgi:hypothetical protein